MKQECEHDWAYDRGFFAQKRECILCKRKEYREIAWSDKGDRVVESDWYLKLKEVEK